MSQMSCLLVVPLGMTHHIARINEHPQAGRLAQVLSSLDESCSRNERSGVLFLRGTFLLRLAGAGTSPLPAYRVYFPGAERALAFHGLAVSCVPYAA